MGKVVSLIFIALSFGVVRAMAQDPVKVDPKHYKVEVDNNQVRVLRIKYGPLEKSVMHAQPFGIVVFLTDARISFHLRGGQSEVREGKAGTAEMTPEEIHLPENLSDKPFEGILIESKGIEWPYAELKDDPLTVDPKHYLSESDVLQNVSEDTFVRILHIKYGPHEKSVMHSHPDAVAVFLTDAHFKFALKNGKSETRDGKAGDVQFTPAETHLPENLGNETAEVILVELKTKPSPKP